MKKSWMVFPFPLISLLPVILFTGITSCHQDRVFYDKMVLEDSDWVYNNKIIFYPKITDTVSPYDVILHFEHTRDYPFENLYYTVETESPDDLVTIDTFNINLISKKGLWVGNCRKNNCRLSTILYSNQLFEHAGTYHFAISQFTRLDTLPGWKEVSLEIQRSGPEK